MKTDPPNTQREVATTQHVRVLFTVKEYAVDDKTPYRVFLSLEGRDKVEGALATAVNGMAFWLTEGATYEDARELANILNAKVDTASLMTSHKVDSADVPN